MPASNQPSILVRRTGRFGLVTIAVHPDAVEVARRSQAKVVAQDRWLVMDPETPVLDSADHVPDLGLAAALNADRTPGEVVLCRNSRPLRVWAVIHDLNRRPTCRKPWIAMALLNTFRELSRRRIESVSIPCLGYAQGVIDADQFFELLATAIREAPVIRRMYIELDCEARERDAVCAALQKLEF